MNFRNSLRRYNPIELLLWFSLPIASPHHLSAPTGLSPRSVPSDFLFLIGTYSRAVILTARLYVVSGLDASLSRTKKLPVWAAEAGARKLRNLHSPMPLSLLADKKR